MFYDSKFICQKKQLINTFFASNKIACGQFDKLSKRPGRQPSQQMPLRKDWLSYGKLLGRKCFPEISRSTPPVLSLLCRSKSLFRFVSQKMDIKVKLALLVFVENYGYDYVVLSVLKILSCGRSPITICLFIWGVQSKSQFCVFCFFPSLGGNNMPEIFSPFMRYF